MDKHHKRHLKILVAHLIVFFIGSLLIYFLMVVLPPMIEWATFVKIVAVICAITFFLWVVVSFLKNKRKKGIILLLAHLGLGLSIGAIIYVPYFYFFLFILPSPIRLTNLLDAFLILLKIICVLLSVAYFTITERKVLAAIQRRKGPNIVGFWGLLQPLSDGLKLIIKEIVVPSKSNPLIFVCAPIMILSLSLLSWSVVPAGFVYDKLAIYDSNQITYWDSFIMPVANLKYGLLFLLALSSLNVYWIIIAGWASNSKYAFLGALRSAAQMISYEVSIWLVLLPVILLAGSLNLVEIVVVQSITGWFILPLLPCGIIFFISMLAETNRAPFDLPEAEAELVAGYNVEYSSIIFAMFFLAEYSNMLLMSTLITILFFGGWLPGFQIFTVIPTAIFFSLKVTVFCFLFILVRSAFPRYRYDQLMDIGWKIFLPITLGFLIFLVGFLIYTNSLIVIHEFLQN